MTPASISADRRARVGVIVASVAILAVLIVAAHMECAGPPEAYLAESVAAGPASAGFSFPLEPGLADLDIGSIDPWGPVLSYIHWCETRQGSAAYPDIGPHGERGEYQQTPIFVADILRLTGRTYDPRDPAQARWAARVWLEHYAPLAGLGPDDGEELAKLYRYGYAGYMELQGE